MMNAIEGAGREALLIKGNQILGTVIVQGIRADEASINFTEEMYDKFILPLAPPSREDDLLFMKIMYPVHKLTFIHFSCGLGYFLSHNVWPDGERLDDWLEDVRIVDKFNFEWGMVPHTFQDVPGFGARRQQMLT